MSCIHPMAAAEASQSRSASMPHCMTSRPPLGQLLLHSSLTRHPMPPASGSHAPSWPQMLFICRPLYGVRSIPADYGCLGCAGQLPRSWAVAGAMPQLSIFSGKGNRLTGRLQAAWGAAATSFPSLVLLNLDDNAIEGPLPAQWSRGWSHLV